nr:hypothetical protein [Tanacetum cinerariifolium]
YVKLLVNLCFYDDTVGMVKCVKAMARRETGWEASGNDIPFSIVQVNNDNLNVFDLLSFFNSKNPLEPYVVIYLASMFTSSKSTNVELISSRLKGALFIDKGQPYLQVERHDRSSQGGTLMHWDQIDLENLLLALENIDIKEWMEQFKTAYLGEASAADDDIVTFKIYEASMLSILVAPI